MNDVLLRDCWCLYFSSNETGSCDASQMDLMAKVFGGLKLCYSVVKSAAAAAAVKREAAALAGCALVLTETFLSQVCPRGFTALLRSERLGCSDEKEWENTSWWVAQEFSPLSPVFFLTLERVCGGGGVGVVLGEVDKRHLNGGGGPCSRGGLRTPRSGARGRHGFLCFPRGFFFLFVCLFLAVGN